MNHTLRLFNIQHYCVHDGPGIRTTLFLKGCPLSCIWCCNPESQRFENQFRFSALRCKQCFRCLNICNKNSVKLIDNVPVFDFEICNACADKKCMQTCYTSAISESGKDYSIQEVFDIIKKDKPFYDNSGGGITLSGGEPLMQPTAVFELLKLCKEAHIHTAIETCGFARQEIILKIAEKTDLFLFDIKIIDDEKHITYTGRSNQQIISNIEALSSINKPIIARIPLIPEITDTLENITQIIELCKKNNIQEATLGIYHNLGIQKYTDFGMPCYFSEDPPLNQNEKYLQYCELFKSNGIACEIL